MTSTISVSYTHLSSALIEAAEHLVIFKTKCLYAGQKTFKDVYKRQDNGVRIPRLKYHLHKYVGRVYTLSLIHISQRTAKNIY